MPIQISNTIKLLFLIIILPTLGSCLKTAGEIQKEQEMEQLLISARESHSTIADLTAKNKELQDQLSSLQGKVDELQQLVVTKNSTQGQSVTAQTTEQQLKLSADVEELKSNVQKVLQQQNESLEKIQKLEEQFKGMSAQTINAENFQGKTNLKELTVEDAEKMVEEKKFNEVINLCKELLTSKISDGKKNRCRYAQGISYKELNQFDEGLLILSQIYTDWPKSSLAPQSLLEIGKILQLKKQEKESQLMFKKLINEYPKTSASKEAKKLLKN